MRFRKKPVVIEAVQFTHDMAMGNTELPDGVRFGARQSHPGRNELHSHNHYIETLEGKMRVEVGDWVITGVKGERYPCKPDIFEATYDTAPPQGEPAEDVARNTHLLEWLGDGFTNCQHGSREWCEGYLHNALDVIAAQDAELLSLRRKVEETEAERDEAFEQCAKIAEIDMRSPMAIASGHKPEWYKHGLSIAKRIRNAARALAGDRP